MLTNGFLVRNFKVGSPGNGNGRVLPEVETVESAKAGVVAGIAALFGLCPRGGCGIPPESTSGTGASQANLITIKAYLCSAYKKDTGYLYWCKWENARFLGPDCFVA